MKRTIRILSFISIVGLLGTSVPVGALSAFPGRNGRIAFTQESNGSPNLWVMNATGDHMRSYTKSGARNPVWSPNGERIVFVNTASDQLFAVQKDGSSRRDFLRGFAGRESEPTWLANGSRLAFVRERIGLGGARQSAIFTVAASGADERLVSGWSSERNYRSPSWSPDGSELAYEAYTPEASSIMIKALSSGAVRTVTEISQVTSSAQVAWSPSGKKILFRDSANEIYTVWPDGSRRAVISDGDSYAASWSPDGKQIAFLEDFDGEDVSVSDETGDVSVIPVNVRGYEEIGVPSWSPSGDKLVFTLTKYKSKKHDKCACTKEVTDIFTLDLSKVTLTKLGRSDAKEFNWQAR